MTLDVSVCEHGSLKRSCLTCEYKEELEKTINSNDMFADNLRKLCTILKGSDGDATKLHSWHDLPEVAAELKKRVEFLENENKRLQDIIDKYEESTNVM